jgi:hypothetical protein
MKEGRAANGRRAMVRFPELAAEKKSGLMKAD